MATIGQQEPHRALGIPRESLPAILEKSLKNFNADPKRDFVQERELLLDVLESTW